MRDGIDLHRAVVHRSPADIADWPITIAISRITNDPEGGLVLEFNHPMDFPEFTPPDFKEPLQFTVWMAVRLGDVWHTAGVVQMWRGRQMGDGTLPEPLTKYAFWCGNRASGDPHAFEEMGDYQPAVGDQVGIFVSSGNARLNRDVPQAHMRSQVALITLQADSRGDWRFDQEQEPPAPPAPPPPPPTPPAPPTPPTPTPDGTIAELRNAFRMVIENLLDLNKHVITLQDSVAAIQSQVADTGAKVAWLVEFANGATEHHQAQTTALEQVLAIAREVKASQTHVHDSTQTVNDKLQTVTGDVGSVVKGLEPLVKLLGALKG